MKKIAILPILGAVLLGTPSCNLDRFPYSSMSREHALSSIEDAEHWNADAYARFRSSVYGPFIRLSDYQADVVSPSASFGNRDAALFTWGIKMDTKETAGIWADYYSHLKHINEFINRIDQVKPNNEAEGNILAGYKGDALFARAFYYTELSKRFAPLYDAKTADKELCVPLVLTFDVTARPPRATQKQVYSQILKDLSEAKALFAKAGKAIGTPRSFTFNGDVVTALESRVYLQMRDYDKALQTSKELINSGRYPLVKPVKESFSAMWFDDTSSEDILRLFVNKDDAKDAPVGVGTYYGASIDGKGKDAKRVCSPDWFPTQGIIDLFEEKDLRKWVYFQNDILVDINGEKLQPGKIVIISKYRGNLALAANTTDPVWGVKPDARNYPVVFRIAESYLNAAEAAYKTGNVADAQMYLNKLRQSRGLTEVNQSGEALFTEIKNERCREFAFEGHRLWDLKRWEMPMNRMPHQVVNGKKTFLTDLDLDKKVETNDYRFTWPIPFRDIQTNPNIAKQQNKGY